MAAANMPKPLCHAFVDEPHTVVIELTQKVTCAQCRELGKVLGKAGFTGNFVGGDVAELARLGAMKKREDQQKIQGGNAQA